MSKDTSQKESIIKAAYADVHKFGQNAEYDKVLKAANRIIGVASDDHTALHCKVVCLIHLGKFEEALKFLERNRLGHLIFEKAYVEYRLNKAVEALNTIDSSEVRPLPVNLKELRTQILYRLERFEDCFDSYKEIIKNTSDEYDDERTTNLTAVAAYLPNDKKRELPDVQAQSFEQNFNVACLLISQQKYAEAEKRLRLCEKQCRETLEEDGLTEEEIRDEVDVIRVQLAYCLQMQGKPKDAVVIYGDCLKNKPKDPALLAVASNNIVVLNKDQNVFDSKKKMKNATADACEHKLNSKQKRLIALNNCLLMLYTSAGDQVHQHCQKLIQNHPDLDFKGLLIRCTQLVKDKKHKEAIDLLEKYSKSKKEQSFASKFAVIQIQLLQGNRKEAIETFLSLGNDVYKPGVVSSLVTLYLGTDQKAEASELLKNAVEWYKKHGASSDDLADMWRQAADFHLRGGESEIAAGSLEELLKLKPNDMKIVAQLVIAYAQFNKKKALEASQKLPPLETLTSANEIDALESANWIMSARTVKKTVTTKGESPGTPAVDKKKRKSRKRKGKLPKNYNAEVPPDPERWLPKYERTGFRKKRDRRNKDVIKGSQGMSSGAADQYDMSNKVNQTKNSPVTPVYQETTPGPRQQYRKGGHKKKKGGRF